MSLPFFYVENMNAGSNALELDESNSRHVVSVLRMQPGEALQLADGKGNLWQAVITAPHKKKCAVAITGVQYIAQPPRRMGIGISLVKNPVRFEWFLEKATEIGVTEIFPLLCNRTEKQHFRYDRMKNVLVSALLQSRQAWLPVLHQPLKFETVLEQPLFQQKMIAHCAEEDKKNLGSGFIDLSVNQLILIGPEGDFTADEIKQALQKNFIPVALGPTRLRTETAGVVAAVLLVNAG